ncbi:hypothetical protein [Bacillus cereus]
MSTNRLLFRAIRKEDFLDLTFELVNVHTEGSPQSLVRINDNEPVLLIVHFPPQHIVEEVRKDTNLAPVQASLSGPSRLVFQLPDKLDNSDIWKLPLNLETLLNWDEFTPVLADPAATGPCHYHLTQEEEAEPCLMLQQPSQVETVLEIPTGLYLSPDNLSSWDHSISPIRLNDRYELWHTRLIFRNTQNEGGKGRVIYTPNPVIPFDNALTSKDRCEITTLSSNFCLPYTPDWVTNGIEGIDLYGYWLYLLQDNNLPFTYTPSPVNIRRLMLSSIGGWANLESSWNYPTILPGRENDGLGYPILSLEQWKHITAQGRDQYVKVVRKVVFHTGHRGTITTITRREFIPFLIRTEQTPQGPIGVYGSKAILQKYSFINVQEPVKDYQALSKFYTCHGREMPFKKITIMTDTTPNITNISDSNFFWPLVSGDNDFLFHLVAEDWEGKKISFECPLLCIPIESEINWGDVVTEYHKIENLIRRTVQTNSQSVAFAKTNPDCVGQTTLKTDEVIFELQLVNEELPPGQPPLLPAVKAASVRLPAVEQFLGNYDPVWVTFNAYRNHDIDNPNDFDGSNNVGEVFAEFSKKLPEPNGAGEIFENESFSLPFPTEKAGGLIKPDTALEGLSRTIGPVSDIENIKQGIFNASVFDDAKFLGSIKLSDILPLPDPKNLDPVKFDPEEIRTVSKLPLEKLQNLLDDPTFQIKVPMLISQPIYNPGADPATSMPIAIETRFLWKPVIKNFSVPSLFNFMTKMEETKFQNKAQLVLQSCLVTPLDTTKETSYQVSGQLTEFAMQFVGALTLRFKSFRFSTENGKKMDVKVEGMDIVFEGPLNFVNTLKDIIPDDGFSDPPNLVVTASGICAGYTLGVPSFGVGVFSLQNLNLSASLSLPFVDQPAGVRFAISERHKPFLVSVGLFGGGGFFSLALNAHGIEEIEASIEFGGNISLNIVVASGGVSVMAGIYFSMTGDDVTLTGYLRCGGNLSVIGLISISVEFYLAFSYNDKGNEVWGQASVTVGVKIAFFSKSVTLTVERKFAGAAGDPTFEQMVKPSDWEEYCLAFA